MKITDSWSLKNCRRSESRLFSVSFYDRQHDRGKNEWRFMLWSIYKFDCILKKLFHFVKGHVNLRLTYFSLRNICYKVENECINTWIAHCLSDRNSYGILQTAVVFFKKSNRNIFNYFLMNTLHSDSKFSGWIS